MKKKERQYRSNQGRSPHQQGSNEMAAYISVIGLIITFVTIIIMTKF